MNVALFCHSLRSCWNHGNAHFLRGVVTELQARGHGVRVLEPARPWSLENLLADHGPAALVGTQAVYPDLPIVTYWPGAFDLDRALDGVELVIVHEWTDVDLVARIGAYRARARSFALLFHDSHHRSISVPGSTPGSIERTDLSNYDGVLAFGRRIRDIYLERGWTRRAWTWHEAADARVFRPLPGRPEHGDLVWIGNWGDGERTAELREFLLAPVRELGLRARTHGVRFPDHALAELEAAGIDHAGWLPNHEVPDRFARYRVTVHIPRRFYRHELPGIPTIRPFEALACGIPLVTSPWRDDEGLFSRGEDYLVAETGAEMVRHLRRVLLDRALARELAENGRRRILERHTCGHRVAELMAICRELGVPTDAAAAPSPVAERRTV
jgi:spore maturation protein CgeB